MMKKQLFSFLALLSLATFSIHSSVFDRLDEFMEAASKKGTEYLEKEFAREKKRKHNQAVRILTKINRKHTRDFECLNKTTDMSKRNCLAFNTHTKKENDPSIYFEQIKEHRKKTESAEFDLDENENTDPNLDAQIINEKMNRLQEEYKRLFNDVIHATRSKERKKSDKKTTEIRQGRTIIIK